MTQLFGVMTSTKLVKVSMTCRAVEVHMRVSSPLVTHLLFMALIPMSQDQLIKLPLKQWRKLLLPLR